MPDAFRGPAGRSRQLPDLRNGARTGARRSRRGRQSRTGGYDPPVLDRTGAYRAGRDPRDGNASHGPSPFDRDGRGPPRTDGSRDASRVVGGLAILRSRMAIACHAQPEHVHADCDGNWRRVALQHGRDPRAPALPASVPQRRRDSRRFISKRRPSSPFLCCLDRFSNCVRGNRPAAPFAPSSTLRPKTARIIHADGRRGRNRA